MEEKYCVEFLVNNMELSLRFPKFVVSNSQEYIYAKFHFMTDDWDDKDKVAYFCFGIPSETNIPKRVELDENGECKIPSSIMSSFGTIFVGVRGFKGIVELPTNILPFELKQGIASLGEETPEEEQSFLSHMFEVLEEIKAAAQSGGGSTGGGVDPSGISLKINPTTGELEATVPDNVNISFAVNNNGELEVTA